MRGLFIVCGAAILGIGLAAQEQTRDRVDVYFDAVSQYQHGDTVNAPRMVTAWPQRDVQRMASVVRTRGDWMTSEAAAMLHTEVVTLEILANREAASVHLGVAEGLVRALPSSEEPFQRNWYAFVASVFAAITNPEGGRAITARAARLFPRDPQVHVAMGVIDEMAAHLDDPDCVGPACESRDANSRAWARLRTAGGEYRQALALDPANADARLRLGRVLFLQNMRKEARAELEQLQRQSMPARLSYLASLFMGALEASEGNWTAAQRQYETAVGLQPDCQTGYVALSHVQQLTGQESRARETIVKLAKRNPNVTDPWLAYQNGSLDRDVLTWLRTKVQR